MQHTVVDRSTLVVALAALAAVNALAWVVLLRVLGGMVGLDVPSDWLGGTAALTGLAVPVAAGAVGMRRLGPHA